MPAPRRRGRGAGWPSPPSAARGGNAEHDAVLGLPPHGMRLHGAGDGAQADATQRAREARPLPRGRVHASVGVHVFGLREGVLQPDTELKGVDPERVSGGQNAPPWEEPGPLESQDHLAGAGRQRGQVRGAERNEPRACPRRGSVPSPLVLLSDPLNALLALIRVGAEIGLDHPSYLRPCAPSASASSSAPNRNEEGSNVARFLPTPLAKLRLFTPFQGLPSAQVELTLRGNSPLFLRGLSC